MARLRIKELAEKQGMRQYQLAELSGVTPQLLNHYWNNQTQRVSLVHLGRIAKALNVRVGELFVSDESDTDKHEAVNKDAA